MSESTGRHEAEYIGQHRAEGYDQLIGVAAHMAMAFIFDAHRPKHAQVMRDSESAQPSLGNAHHFQQFLRESNKGGGRHRP